MARSKKTPIASSYPSLFDSVDSPVVDASPSGEAKIAERDVSLPISPHELERVEEEVYVGAEANIGCPDSSHQIGGPPTKPPLHELPARPAEQAATVPEATADIVMESRKRRAKKNQPAVFPIPVQPTSDDASEVLQVALPGVQEAPKSRLMQKLISAAVALTVVFMSGYFAGTLRHNAVKTAPTVIDEALGSAATIYAVLRVPSVADYEILNRIAGRGTAVTLICPAATANPKGAAVANFQQFAADNALIVSEGLLVDGFRWFPLDRKR